MLHPQVRILTLLVFIAATATARPAILLAAAALLALAYPATGSHDPAALWRMIMRLRWLFVAILLVVAVLVLLNAAWSRRLRGVRKPMVGKKGLQA